MEKFEIKNRKGLKIVGEILKPENSIGLSFVLHGLGGFKEQVHIKALEDTLFENNYIVVNFDATNSIGESDGKYEDATMQNHYEDLVDVIDWAKKQNWYKEPFVLAGHSLGGFAVAKYAEEFSNEVKGVFPYAAVFSGPDNVETSYRLKPEETKNWEETGWIYRTSNSKPGMEMKLPWSHIQERLKHDLKLRADKITMPILFVMGENDSACPPDDEKKFYDLLPAKTDKEFHVIKNAQHTFREPEHLEQLKNIFNNWLKKLK
jgi:dipeptidyl aminopeptidase/acylaminoacyl peptidase